MRSVYTCRRRGPGGRGDRRIRSYRRRYSLLYGYGFKKYFRLDIHTTKELKTKGVLDLIVKKGDLFFADLRPVLVVQNDVGNKYSPTIIVAAVTSQTGKAKLPTHVQLAASQGGLSKDSVVLLEQLRTIDKQRLKERIGALNETQLPDVEKALSVSLGIANSMENR